MKWAALTLLVGSWVLDARDAEACGCFMPPQSVTVVTDHRMILSITKDRTTLYDQIRYSGDPAEFAWVLPIKGTVDVASSADVLFASLDAMTQTTVRAPSRVCPPTRSCFNGASFGQDASAGSRGEVEVTKREVVGPYETVQLKATDPQALQDWLASNGFNLPSEVKPIVGAYQAEGFGFLALKLAPNQGVSSMRPIRVTTQGAAPAPAPHDRRRDGRDRGHHAKQLSTGNGVRGGGYVSDRASGSWLGALALLALGAVLRGHKR